MDWAAIVAYLLVAGTATTIVLGAGRIIFLQGALKSCKLVNDHLLKERDEVLAFNKALQEANKKLQLDNNAILNKPFHIRLDEPELQNLAALLGPYLTVTVDGKASKPLTH